MQPVKPAIVIPGDRADKIMAQNGWIRGYRNHPPLIVWQFGFLPESVQAQAYGVSVDEYIWVLADPKGKKLAVAYGDMDKLPAKFQVVLGKANV